MRISKRSSLKAAALIASMAATLLGASSARAASVLYDFENLPTGPGTSASLSSPDAPADATLSGGFNIVDLSSQSGTTLFDTRSVVPAAGSTAPLVISFPFTVNSVSAQIGHFGGAIDTLSVKAYGTETPGGTPLAEATTTLPAVGTLFNFRTLLLNASGIRSIELFGGAGAENTDYFDNVGVTTASTAAVPLPAAAAMFPLAAAIGMFAARRMRRA